MNYKNPKLKNNLNKRFTCINPYVTIFKSIKLKFKTLSDVYRAIIYLLLAEQSNYHNIILCCSIGCSIKRKLG